jgi:hypothetical protein
MVEPAVLREPATVVLLAWAAEAWAATVVLLAWAAEAWAATVGPGA